MDEESLPLARTDMPIPRMCGNCGTEAGTQRFLLTTGAGGTAHTIVAWCEACAEKAALALLRAWPQAESKTWTCDGCRKPQSIYGLNPHIVTLVSHEEVRLCAGCHHDLTRQKLILTERK